MTTTVAALDGGTYYHHEALHQPRYAQSIDRLIYAPELARVDLAGIDILIVTCRTSFRLLQQARSRIERFLADGHTLVVMGETLPMEWLSAVEWTDAPTNFWWWLDRNAQSGLSLAAPDHGLFRYLTLADATWHFHGHFKVPAGATSLVDCAFGGSILYDDPVSTPGRLIVTSLDPFYHHGARFMPAATRFLDGFLPWLKAGAPA